MSVAELKAQGFNDAQIKAIQSTAKTAMQAATQVKTLGGVLDVAKETAQSGWAQTWQIIFGDFGEAKTLFTGVSNAVNGFINASADARNKVLGDWKELGGRTVLIKAIKTAFEALGQIMKPIKEAFRDIFPAQTGKSLYDLTVRFKEFTETLKPSPETVANLHRTFRGLFAILDIGKQVISGIFTMFGKLFGAVGAGRGSFLNFTGNIGDFLVALDKALKKGDVFNNFFSKMGAILAIPIKVLTNLARLIGSLFTGFSPGGFSTKMGEITKAAQPFQKMVAVIKESVEGLGPAINQAISAMNFEAILEVIKVGLLGALVIMIKNFFAGGTFAQAIGGIGGGIFKNLRGVTKNMSSMFGSLAGSMKAMQQNIQAKTLKEIAIAIALLAASVLALSLVDPQRLDEALTAMTIAFAELLGAMKIMATVGTTGVAKLPIIAASLIMLAAALDLLAISVIAFSRLSWEQLAKGLGAVAALLTTLSVASGPLSKNSVRMIAAGAAITTIAVAMLILAKAVNTFGTMDLNVIGKGLLGVGGGLTVIAGAMQIMPKSIPITAAGLLVLSLSLGKIAKAVASFGGMSMEKMGKGMLGLAASLGILAIALHAMSGTMGGAVALGVAAAGLALLTPAIIALGKQSWSQILRSLATLAITLGLLGVAGALLTPVVPALLGLGAAMMLLGGGLALAGAGIALIGVGLSSIAVAGPAAIGILIKALTDFTKAVPEMVQNLVLGLLSMVKAFATTAPQFVDAMIKILESILQVIIQSAPKIAEAFFALVTAAINILSQNQDRIIKAGFDLLMALLNGIKNNISRVTLVVIDIIIRFLATLTANLSRIIAAGLNLVIALITGIANNLGRVATAALSIITSFLSTIASNLGRIVTAGLSILTKFLGAIASGLGQVITAGTNVIASFVRGIGDAAGRIVTAARESAGKFINTLARQIVALADNVFTALITLINGMANTIERRAPELRNAGLHLGWAIIDGMTWGLAGKAQSVYNKAIEIGNNVKHFLGKAWGKFNSPPSLAIQMGQDILMGLAIGLSQSKPALDAAFAVGNGVIKAFNNIFQTASPSKVMYQIGQYVGQGFANGLRGSAQDINSVFTELNDKLTVAMTTARETIAKEQDKLDKLREAKKPDADAIKKVQETIAENQKLLANATAAHESLVTTLRKEKTELIGLVNDYDKISTRLKAAQDVLAQAKKTREDALAGYEGQYAALPTIQMTDAEGNPIDPSTMLTNYLQALSNQTAAVGAYNSTLQQLRELGLDDATYQKLLAEGTADQSFANQLLAGGKTAVEGLNKLDRQLFNVSQTLAVNAADNLYKAGVDAAAGLVRGLESKRSAIRRKIDEIADDMIQELRAKLKSKSPSEEFADIGRDSMKGLAQGFTTSSKIVTDAVDQAAKDALTAMQQSMNKISDLVTDELDPNPTITPILDLTRVQTQAKDLNSMISATPIIASASFGQASAISSERTAVQEELTTVAPGGTSVKFEQNNYSPEALSEVEIYRQTKNQLSQLKSALALD
jgi:phage-related protein